MCVCTHNLFNNSALNACSMYAMLKTREGLRTLTSVFALVKCYTAVSVLVYRTYWVTIINDLILKAPPVKQCTVMATIHKHWDSWIDMKWLWASVLSHPV